MHHLSLFTIRTRGIFLLLFILFLQIGCDKDEATNSEEDRILTCGSSLETPFQCISAAGKSTITTYDIPEIYGCWDSKDFDFCVRYDRDGTGTITYKPSGLSPGSTQKIKWGAMVDSKGKLLLSNAGTIYIAHESLEGSLDPQIALLSFKQSTKLWYGFDLAPIGSCAAVTPGPGTGETGSIIFWTKSDLGCGNITVRINNQVGTISQYFTSGEASCDREGGAVFNLPAGNYTFTAECSDYEWKTTPVTIYAGGCSKMQLK